MTLFSSFRPGRRCLAALSTLLLAFAAVLAGAQSAAAVTLVTCSGTQTIQYSPGLTNTPATVTASGTNQLGPCVAPNTSITSGTITFSSTGTYSCQELLGSSSVTNVIHWSDGSTSTLQVVRTATKVNGQLINTFTGSVTAGTFQGATVVWTITNVSLALLACETPQGLTSLTGVDVFGLVSV
ncbi:hypothetical protein [Streptomyces sp. NPDC047130]|uniref:hypothetical protein n=1 Tax=Streptomyces sp. NPDC047130 TaxID=3155261 RepID=UPI0033EEAFC9